MKVYKLTDENCCTYNNTQWGEGVTHETNGKGDLCSCGWLHCYQDPRIAVIMNPAHADFTHTILWEAEAEGEFLFDGQLKMGCTKLTTTKQILLPEISTEKRIEFAIRCALKVCGEPSFVRWANDWLSGEDRSAEAAARAAAWAARAAAEAADAAWAAEAAWAAAEAARAASRAARAARAASRAARAAVEAVRATEAANFDLVAILNEMEI